MTAIISYLSQILLQTIREEKQIVIKVSIEMINDSQMDLAMGLMNQISKVPMRDFKQNNLHRQVC